MRTKESETESEDERERETVSGCEGTYHDWHDGPKKPLVVVLHVACSLVLAVVDKAKHLLRYHRPWPC